MDSFSRNISSLPALQAAGTVAEEAHAVGGDQEIGVVPHQLLQIVYQAYFQDLNGTAGVADQVVMDFSCVYLVILSVFVKMHVLGEAQFTEELHGSIDGSEAQVGMSLQGQLIDILRT